MIIKGRNESSELLQRDWSLIVIIVLLIIASIAFKGRAFFHATPKENGIVHCSMETIKDGKYIEAGNVFLNAETQSEELARSGKYSCLLDKLQYGMTYVLKSPVGGQTYKASIWRRTHERDNSFLTVKSTKGEFYIQSNEVVKMDGDFWGKLEITFTIPSKKDVGDVEVYVYKTQSTGKAYFDDFHLQKYEDDSRATPGVFEPDNINLQIALNDIERLSKIKKRAYKDGIYIKQESDEVRAKLKDGDKLKKVKIRFKGDWLDHLSWKGESYRINVNKNEAWRGMQSFSVQRPETRSHLNEWVYHQWLEQEGVLSPRYDFINFSINDNDSKIYVYEEHFNKNLLEHKLRREGPILKFDESRFWEGIKRSLDISRILPDIENKNKAFWSSEISAFNRGKIEKDSTLSRHFVQARTLLNQYKRNLKLPSQIFDLQKMARFVAISELCNAHHALTWHNQRFYYNPIINMLEPIGYDGFGEKPSAASKNLYTERVFDDTKLDYEPLDQLFKNREFLDAYITELIRLSSAEYVNILMSKLEESINEREQFIRTGNPNYNYDRKEITTKSEKIRKELLPYKNSIEIHSIPYKADSLILKITNHHSLPLLVSSDNIFVNAIFVLPNAKKKETDGSEYIVHKSIKSLFYTLPGSHQEYKKVISQHGLPLKKSARQLLGVNGKQAILKNYSDTLSFLSDSVLITEPLVIPGGKSLLVKGGTNIKFSKNGIIISESPLFLLGDKHAPITIEGLSDAVGGIVVLQSAGKSNIVYTNFNNLSAISYHGWEQTGAVSFYESDVKITYSTFTNINSEDALNIVKSNFNLSNCTFVEVKSDAFDADFCKGIVSDCTFINTGNDAIDVSTSEVEISNCFMKDIGDKAISAGEKATVTVKGTVIDGANFGVASKDYSILNIESIDIKNSEHGFAAYQKKPEFGPAKIYYSDFTYSNVRHPFMIEQGSTFLEN